MTITNTWSVDILKSDIQIRLPKHPIHQRNFLNKMINQMKYNPIKEEKKLIEILAYRNDFGRHLRINEIAK